jgi:hypothetical protein
MRSLPKNLDFAELPPNVREEVEIWQKVLRRAVDCRPVRPILRQIASGRRVGLATVYRKLRAFETHGWRGLVNRAKFPMSPPAPPRTFRAFLHALWIVNGKSYRATHEQVVAMWKGGAKIPGYVQRPRVSPFNPHPDGWTYANFVYHIKKAEANRPHEREALVANRTCESRSHGAHIGANSII